MTILVYNGRDYISNGHTVFRPMCISACVRHATYFKCQCLPASYNHFLCISHKCPFINSCMWRVRCVAYTELIGWPPTCVVDLHPINGNATTIGCVRHQCTRIGTLMSQTNIDSQFEIYSNTTWYYIRYEDNVYCQTPFYGRVIF